MELILGVSIILITHIWILKKLKNWKPYKYDTMFCRDTRANLDMIAYASDIEATRSRLSRSNSKF